MLALTGPAAAASGPGSLRLAFAHTGLNLAPGGETTITVSLANYDARMAGLRAVGVEITWDTGALQIVPGSFETLLTTGTAMILTTAYNTTTDMLIFTYLSTGADTFLERGKEELFSFTLNAAGTSDASVSLSVALKVSAADSDHVVPVANAPVIQIMAGSSGLGSGSGPEPPGSGSPGPAPSIPPGTAAPSVPDAYINPFTDVKEGDWFYVDVMKAHKTGLVNGTSATTFSPGNSLTYAEAVKLAACMHQHYTTGEVSLENGSPWYQSYVDYAKQNGIISGDYAWNMPATRAGYMEIFAKALPDSALAAINTVTDGSIPDVPMSHPQSAAIYKLYRAGIVQGVDAQRNCNPGSDIKRSEVAAILTRMMEEDVRITF